MYFATEMDTTPVGKIPIRPTETRVETLEVRQLPKLDSRRPLTPPRGNCRVHYTQEMLMLQTGDGKTWFFCAGSEEAAVAWSMAIREAHTMRLDAAGNVTMLPPPPTARQRTKRGGSRRSPRRGNGSTTPSRPSRRSFSRRESNAAAVFTLMDPMAPSVASPVLPSHPYDAFKHMFVVSTDDARRSAITRGCLRGSPLRSLCWKVFLGCVPTSCGISAWGEYLRFQRKGYERLRRRHSMETEAEAEE